MTVAKQLSNNWELLKTGMCVLQVQQGEILVYIGSSEPQDSDSINSYIINDFFQYSGNESVYVKARGQAKIVYDDGL